MKITRKQHEKFLSRAIPVLTLAYFLQSYVYLELFPTQFTKEVIVVLGLCLLGLFFYYSYYHRLHQAHFYSQSFEVNFPLLQLVEEIYYREIVDVEIKGKHSFRHVLIHLESGQIIKLSNVDNAEEIKKFLMQRC